MRQKETRGRGVLLPVTMEVFIEFGLVLEVACIQSAQVAIVR